LEATNKHMFNNCGLKSAVIKPSQSSRLLLPRIHPAILVLDTLLDLHFTEAVTDSNSESPRIHAVVPIKTFISILCGLRKIIFIKQIV